MSENKLPRVELFAPSGKKVTWLLCKMYDGVLKISSTNVFQFMYISMLIIYQLSSNISWDNS